MTALHELSTAQFKQAIQIREQIDALQGKLDALLGGSSAPKRKLGRHAGKRTMSAATIEKMRTAQQARWAKINEKTSPKKAAVSAKASPKKKVMSLETKAKLAAAMKARWAAKKKAESAL